MESIREFCLRSTSSDPIAIAKEMMETLDIPMHGPIHHILDGAALMTALHNHGLDFDLEAGLRELEARGSLMPGATCGKWGVCGSASSVGAAMSIIRGTGPLSDDEYYMDNMRLTSMILERIARIGGPRCCKRNCFIALSAAVEFLKYTYRIELPASDYRCSFFEKNAQCIKTRCLFYGEDWSQVLGLPKELLDLL